MIRHSQITLEPGVPSRKWKLSEEGRQRCKPLAEQLAPYQPPIITTSSEVKAIDTGRLVCEHLDIPCQTAPNLHEQKRDNVGLFPTPEAFQAAVINLFRRPDSLVFGQETAVQARTRFTRAVEAVIGNQPEGNVAIVAHGTVISLFAAARANIDIVSFWQQLSLPGMVIFSLPKFELLEVIRF